MSIPLTESASSRPPLPFEQSLSELQRIVSDLESGSLGLEQSLSRFEQGIGLLRTCYETLERAEAKIEILTGVDANGNPTFAPFDASATATQQGHSAGRRSRKKAVKPTAEADASGSSDPTANPSQIERAEAPATSPHPDATGTATTADEPPPIPGRRLF